MRDNRCRQDFVTGGGSEVWVYRGSRVRRPPVPVVLSVYQRGSLLDGLAMYLSCDTKKFHDNESTHILHNFWTSNHGGSFPPSPLAAICITKQRIQTATDLTMTKQALTPAPRPSTRLMPTRRTTVRCVW